MTSTQVPLGTVTGTIPQTYSRVSRSPIKLDNETEAMINKLVNIFFCSAYRCKWAAHYFDRPDVALFGIADLHRWSVLSDAVMARGLLEYLKVRGGQPVFEDIEAPNQKQHEMEYLTIEENSGRVKFENVPSDENASGKSTANVVPGIKCLIMGKRAIYDFVLKLYKVACDKKDRALTDFLEVNYIRPMANVLQKLGVLQTQAELACREVTVGIYQFNKDIEKNLFGIMMYNKLVRPDKWSLFM